MFASYKILNNAVGVEGKLFDRRRSGSWRKRDLHASPWYRLTDSWQIGGYFVRLSARTCAMGSGRMFAIFPRKMAFQSVPMMGFEPIPRDSENGF